MQQDAFFADYGDSNLLIRGTVASVDQKGSAVVVELKTGVPMKVECALGNPAQTIRLGETVTVLSTNPRRDASRLSDAVRFENCRVAHAGN